MRHLTEGELLDLAEGAQPDTSVGHLAACEACRRHLADLRSIMTAVTDLEVPEPSPLFWAHLSARVREGIEAEGRPPAAGWLSHGASWRVIVPIGALATLLLAAAVMLRPGLDPSTATDSRAGSEVTDVAAEANAIDLVSLAEDPSLTLLADLTSDLDWDAATEAGLAPRAGAVDYFVTTLSSEERQELQRLLQEALSPPGA